MKQRIYTHHMIYSQVIAADPNWVYVLSADQFVAQDDIDLVGVELNVEMCAFNQNDNFTMAYGELSQNGNWAQDGSILRGQCTAAWNSSPAFGYYVPSFRTVIFPYNCAIPIKEEGNVYLHVQYQGASAGTTSLGVHANLYYVKRSGR